MRYILTFDDAGASELRETGGKGASLARMQRAGFPIPAGFIVGTEAYADHIAHHQLGPVLAALCARIDFAQPESLEARTAEIRDAITAAPIADAIRDAVLAAYRKLGSDRFVAVRSSGTAEDLAQASFAGMHDTYLDVRGDADLLDAIRRCWASMWTARATAYRHRNGFAHDEHRLAIVVLEMVAAEVAGVMFTANPVTTAVDEFVVNAAWGLGEGIVSGQVTPDEFIVGRTTFDVRKRILGSKAIKIVRDPGGGRGTATVPVAAADRARFALTDPELVALAQVGQRVAHYFGDWPQDIEWALADGRFYVLQSRDITGVAFSWDEDIDAHGRLPRLRDDAVLSRARSDTVWTGRITPLFYSLRSEGRVLATPRIYRLWAGSLDAQRRWGFAGQPIGELRWYKYHRGAVYFNSEVEFRNYLQTVPPRVRNRAVCEWTPPSWMQDLERRPGSWRNVIRIAARIGYLKPRVSPQRIFASLHEHIRTNANGWGMAPEALRQLDDGELKRYVQQTVQVQSDWVRDIANVFYLYGPFMSSCLLWMFEHWYTGADRSVYPDLITGLPEPTFTVKQNDALWALAEKIRESKYLLTLFRQFQGAAFFTEVAHHDEGRAFLACYRGFLADFGHRGQADRDIWYPRRSEDPDIDYRALSLLLQAAGQKAGASERERTARREAAREAVLASIRKQPFGAVKAALFRYVQQFMLRFFVFRDDSRHQTDRNTYAKKKAVQELGRRVYERGLLEQEDDFFYLAKDELFALLDGNARNLRVVHAKVAARRRNCERYRREWSPPMYILGNGTVYVEPGTDAEQTADDGMWCGIGMSRGEATGRARVLSSLDQLGKLERGDILVARGTDPGWTPAFIVISGLVLETGGTLSHGACLAREYGIPAVQVNDAMSRIVDGSVVRISGDTGEVRIIAATAATAPMRADERQEASVAMRSP